MPQHHEERRRFDRIATDKPVVVRDRAAEYFGTVLDVSLRGLLFVIDTDWRPEPGLVVQAQIRLDGEHSCIDLEGEVAHVEDNRIGLRCTRLDLYSARRLRRLVELNLADHELLQRNLSQLTAA